MRESLLRPCIAGVHGLLPACAHTWACTPFAEQVPPLSALLQHASGGLAAWQQQLQHLLQQQPTSLLDLVMGMPGKTGM